jgi:NADP-dependent 3-hydroxy acid dehydrogenase YdfG
VKLKDQTFLVTGGSSGVGAALAAACVAEGARVAVTGRSEERLQAVVAPLGEAAAAYVGDVRHRERVDEIVADVVDRWGGIDVLVNNAGVNVVDRSLEKLTPENWDLQLDINVTGAFNLIHAVLPHMRKRGRGLVIAISSMAGLRVGTVSGAAYSASKHAMAALTRSVDLEESPNGIRGTVISPGEIDTPILEARPVKVTDEHRARILQPEDVAAAVVYVASQPDRVSIPELVIKPHTQGA